jgi:hypothetical protein
MEVGSGNDSIADFGLIEDRRQKTGRKWEVAKVRWWERPVAAIFAETLGAFKNIIDRIPKF